MWRDSMNNYLSKTICIFNMYQVGCHMIVREIHSHCLFAFVLWPVDVVFWPSTRPKMPFKVMHRKEVTHSNGSYERKSRGRKLVDEMGRGKKNPMVHS